MNDDYLDHNVPKCDTSDSHLERILQRIDGLIEQTNGIEQQLAEILLNNLGTGRLAETSPESSGKVEKTIDSPASVPRIDRALDALSYRVIAIMRSTQELQKL